MRRCGLVLVLILCTSAISQLNPSMQRRVAGFFATFPAFVTWPAGAFPPGSQTIHIGFVGPNPMGEAGRRYLRGRASAGKEFVLSLLHPGESFEGYQILYFGDIEEEELKKLLKRVAKKPVLTVGETPKFIENGGIVQFHIDGKAVTFDVSNVNARRAGLRISPRMAKYGMSM